MNSSSERRRLVGVSTKMYFDFPKTLSYLQATLKQLQPQIDKLAHGTDVFMIPDFLTIVSVAQAIKEFNDKAEAGASRVPLLVGAQDTHHEDAGAFTGEISPVVLSQAGVKLVEIGHAERRRYFGETDDWVIQKAKAILRNRMTPLICIGEQKREGGIDAAVEECWKQVSGVFEDTNVQDGSAEKELVLAYEPVWAIGASEPASADHVVAVTQKLREKCKAAGSSFKGSVRIVYGGSAGPGLFEKIQDGVDGLFLGRFAHDPERFVKTIIEVAGGLKSSC